MKRPQRISLLEERYEKIIYNAPQEGKDRENMQLEVIWRENENVRYIQAEFRFSE